MSVIIKPTSDVVPANLECIMSNANWQLFVALLNLTVPDGAKINIGNTTPAPADRDAPWFRTNSDGTPDRIYMYALGFWLSPHPLPAGMVTLWEGSEANIATYDGGEAGAITSTAGPFWERVTQMDGKFPLQPGTLQPSGTARATEGLEGGADEIELENEQLPNNPFGVNNLSGIITAVSAGGEYTVDTIASGNQHKTGQWAGNGDPVPTIPPYRTIWFLRRTNRLYHRAP